MKENEGAPFRHPIYKNHHQQHPNVGFTAPTNLKGTVPQVGPLTDQTAPPFLQLHPIFSWCRGLGTSPTPKHILVSTGAQKNINSNYSLSCLDNGHFTILPPTQGPSLLLEQALRPGREREGG